MGGALLLGFFIGMRHALEADHVAAVASLVSGSRSRRDAVRLGLAWGMGHTATLCFVGALVMSLDTVLPMRIALVLEFAVGLMLIWLGFDVLRRLVRARVHFHTHRHADGTEHFHAHAHSAGGPHNGAAHDHFHVRHAPLRAFVVGLMHGMAGSAALILVALDQFESLWTGLFYLALFGAGSMAGMALLSVAIAVPLRRALDRITWAYNALIGGVGVVTVCIGAWVIYQTVVIEGVFGA